MFQDLETLMKRQRQRSCDYTAVWTADDAAVVAVAAVAAPVLDPQQDPQQDPQRLERLNAWAMRTLSENANFDGMTVDQLRAVFDRMTDDELDAVIAAQAQERDGALSDDAGAPAEQQAGAPAEHPLLDPQVLHRLNEYYDFMLGSHSDDAPSGALSDDARDALFDRMGDDELDAVFARMP
jgi:hypothetical protein